MPTLANSFEPVIYTGNGTSQNITTSFEPDLVWIKNRNDTYEHFLFDSVRGAGGNKDLNSDSTNFEGEEDTAAYGFLSSFNTNGFSLSAGTTNAVTVNNNNDQYVAWCWKAGGVPSINKGGSITSSVSANQAAGFSVVKFTGTSSNVSVGHGLNEAPELFIVKSLSTENWFAYTTAIDGTMDYLVLNTQVAVQNATQSLPSTTVFYQNQSNASIAYCFHSVDGYQRISKYPGSGVAGKRVYVTNDGLATGSGGFQPSYVLIKCSSDGITDWLIFTSNVVDGNGDPVMLRANTNESQFTGDRVQFTSDGFTIEDNDGSRNGSGRTYIFLAIK